MVLLKTLSADNRVTIPSKLLMLTKSASAVATKIVIDWHVYFPFEGGASGSDVGAPCVLVYYSTISAAFMSASA